ncbi:MAG: GNAT family N-acetyltransferase [Verrucomicrobiota bacterium]
MISIDRVDPRGEAALRLSELSWAELNGLYRDIDHDEFLAIDFASARSAFVIANVNGAVAGCGAIRPLQDNVAEVRRMFVEPKMRQLGIGRKIMSALEEIARELKYDALQLETGLRQPPAIRLYESAGYERIAPYGRYRDDPLSVCFKKNLSNLA